MPKDTFFNLPEEKREIILEATIDEFAVYSFDQASINRIVKKSEIAKGSFYQYFEDKKDLYFFLIERMGEEKQKYLLPVFQRLEEYDFFAAMREFTLGGIKFAVQNPRYARIGTLLIANKESGIYAELMADNKGNVNDFFKILLENGIKRGEINSDIEIEMLSTIIGSMYTSVIEFPGLLDSGKFEESILERVNIFIDLLKNGIGEKLISG